MKSVSNGGSLRERGKKQKHKKTGIIPSVTWTKPTKHLLVEESHE